MRNIAFVYALLSSGAAWARPSDARPEKEPVVIQDTGIKAFDDVFGQVRAIHATLGAAEGRIHAIEARIVAAAGQPAGTSVQNAIVSLREKAGGQLQVKMVGLKPVLTVGGTGGAEVKAALAEINGAGAELVGITADLAKIPEQVKGLISACQALPGQLNPALLAQSGLSPLALPKVAKTLAMDVKATVQTPEHVASLVGAVKGLTQGIVDGANGLAEPVAAVAEAPAAKAPKAAKAAPVVAAVAAVAGPVGDRLAAARGHLTSADYGAALGDLTDAENAARSASVSAADLGALYQTRAAVYYLDGDPGAALADLARAMAIHPAATADASFGPDVARLYKTVQKAGVLRPIDVTIAGTGSVWLDGKEVPAGTTVALSGGDHLLQYPKGAGYDGMWVHLGHDQTLTAR
jgi:hypothetical protein